MRRFFLFFAAAAVALSFSFMRLARTMKMGAAARNQGRAPHRTGPGLRHRGRLAAAACSGILAKLYKSVPEGHPCPALRTNHYSRDIAADPLLSIVYSTKALPPQCALLLFVLL